ncbi:MAG: hypothetical protein K9N49_00630 [Candidatus Marinimicrobia bacterium]|nr:hypothetical protein [Candidatus Neomarinimicrobiota bacterium]
MTRETLERLYQGRFSVPAQVNDIPHDGYMVYILACDDEAIVVGHGKANRAKVIFDDAGQRTTCHVKALLVRAFHLFGNHTFERYIIPCESKDDARANEKRLHDAIGGNARRLPEEIRQQIFEGIDPESTAFIVLQIALLSSYDGLTDLKLWRRRGVLNDGVWHTIANKLQLHDPDVPLNV